MFHMFREILFLAPIILINEMCKKDVTFIITPNVVFMWYTIIM